MKKLTREMLVIERKNGGQKCKTCPFYQNKKLTCRGDELNGDLADQIDLEFPLAGSACVYNSITLKPEYNGLD